MLRPQKAEKTNKPCNICGTKLLILDEGQGEFLYCFYCGESYPTTYEPQLVEELQEEYESQGGIVNEMV